MKLMFVVLALREDQIEIFTTDLILVCKTNYKKYTYKY